MVNFSETSTKINDGFHMYVLLSFIDLWPCYNLSYRRIPYHRKQWVHIVYDPSIALVHVWSQHVMWLNIPQLKQGDIPGYHLSDIPQFSNLTSTMISVHLKFNPRWEGDLWLLQTKEIFVCSESYQRILKIKYPISYDIQISSLCPNDSLSCFWFHTVATLLIIIDGHLLHIHFEVALSRVWT